MRPPFVYLVFRGKRSLRGAVLLVGTAYVVGVNLAVEVQRILLRTSAHCEAVGGRNLSSRRMFLSFVRTTGRRRGNHGMKMMILLCVCGTITDPLRSELVQEISMLLCELLPLLACFRGL
jgi:hypothetical protein